MTIDLTIYDRFIVAFSGGKDSLDCLLYLLEAGVPKHKIEAWHHDVDGDSPEAFMDWPCSVAYARAVCEHLGIMFYLSYRDGGFKREMLRENQPTAHVMFEWPSWTEIPGSDAITWRMSGGKGKPNTRLLFPQVSADLSVRWCSSSLKIGVAEIAICNQERFKHGKTLFVTGERAQESPARSRYKVFEPHRTDRRQTGLRYVDHFRPIHGDTEAQVWERIQRHGIVVHPAYRLGWGRVSCFACIFGSDNQWASVRAVAPAQFQVIADLERRFGKTIHRKLSVEDRANKGQPYAATSNPVLVQEAMSRQWLLPVYTDNWQLPAGAFGESTGPT